MAKFTPGQSGNPSGRPRPRFDGWSNVLTGLGVEGRDKRMGGVWTPTMVSYQTARDTWRGSVVADRMVTVWPYEMTRAGWRLRSDDLDFSSRITARTEELGVLDLLREIMEYGRAYGHGSLLLGVNDGQPLDQPLDLERVISFDFLTPLDARDIQPVEYYSDPTRPKYREPSLYEIQVQSIGPSRSGAALDPRRLVHESRLIIEDGIRTSRHYTGENGGHGDSIFVRANQIISDFEAACAAIGILVTDFSTPVYKMNGLVGIVAAQGTSAGELFTTRMRAMEMGRSVAGVRLIDGLDELKRETTNVTGLRDLWDAMCAQLAMCAELPLTLLMGQSPGGLNATGESDIRLHYDRVAARQASKLRPKLERIVRIVAASLGLKEPESWVVEFNPLWQPSAKEQADTRSTQAVTDEKYWAMGVLSPEEIRESRFTGDGDNFGTTVEKEAPPDEDRAALRPEDPAAVEPASTATDVQSQALNGSQMATAWAMIKDVAAGAASREAAIASLQVFFPTITAEIAARMLGPESFQPVVPPAPAPGSPVGKPESEPEESEAEPKPEESEPEVEE